MITKAFLESREYQEFKTLLTDTIQNKPINLKTEGKTNEMIAREVTAYEIASHLIEKAIRKFERQIETAIKEKQKFI